MPVFLPGEPHGQRSLAGNSAWGCKESDTTTATWHTHVHNCWGEKREKQAGPGKHAGTRGRQSAVWKAPRRPCDPRASVLCDTLVRCSACVFMEGIGIQLYFPELFSFISSSLETTISWIRCIALVCISVISTLVLITSFYFFGFFFSFFFLLSEVAQSCLTLSDPMDCSLQGSSVHSRRSIFISSVHFLGKSTAVGCHCLLLLFWIF